MMSEEKEKPNMDIEPEIAESEDVESLRQALAEEQAKAEANLAGWQRAQADYANFKRRSEQDREEFARFANTSLLLELLPVLDDLERAIEHVPAKLANSAWVDGVKLVCRKFSTVLEVLVVVVLLLGVFKVCGDDLVVDVLLDLFVVFRFGHPNSAVEQINFFHCRLHRICSGS